jgi:undecaprenyl-diphosphatase
MVDAIQIIDFEIFQFINSHHSVFFDRFFSVITWLGSGWVAVPLVGIIIAAVTPRRRLAAALACAAIAGTLAGVVNTQVKRVVDRPRPVALLKEHPGSGAPPVRIVGDTLRRRSFPSGHAATAFAAATMLAVPYGGYFYCAYAAALLVVYSRVYMGVHFPLDTLGGMIIGTGAALLVTLLFRWRRLSPRGGAHA